MRPVNRFLEQWIPSALTFAIVLTLIVAVLAFILTDASPTEVVTGWGEGLAGLLAFMTQMCLILLLGHMLANTGPVRKLLTRLASVPGSPAFAYVFVFVVAALASLITWGLGLVVGALLAREIAVQARSRGLKVHFPLLVAAGYSGFIVWHMGYSGSGPLTAATPDSFLAESLGERSFLSVRPSSQPGTCWPSSQSSSSAPSCSSSSHRRRMPQSTNCPSRSLPNREAPSTKRSSHLPTASTHHGS